MTSLILASRKKEDTRKTHVDEISLLPADLATLAESLDEVGYELPIRRIRCMNHHVD